MITPSRTMPRTNAATSRLSLFDISTVPISSSTISTKADIVVLSSSRFGVAKRARASGQRYIPIWAIWIRGEACVDFIGKMYRSRRELLKTHRSSCHHLSCQTRCGRLRIICREDSRSSPLIPEPRIISGLFGRPGTRSSDHPAMGPRQASSTEPRTKTTFINWIERCSDARKYRHITKFRVDRNVTHSLAANPLLSCENRSATSPR